MAPSSIQQCPLCARVLYFSHEDTTIIQCVCGAVVNRNESGEPESRPFYIIRDPFDIIQPGTNGKWKGKEFRVLGRFRAWFPESVFNYWTILFPDGELAWLGEGYGMYAVYKKTEVSADSLLKFDKLKTAEKAELFEDQTFVLEKRYEVEKWEVEGELYLPECNPKFEVYDLSSQSGRQVSVFRLLPKLYVSFEVFNSSFRQLQLTDTRTGQHPSKSVACPNCRKQVTIKTFPFAQSFVCSNCNAYISFSDGTYKTASNQYEGGAGPDISLGSTGMINGILYECIGYALKEENNKYRSKWKEYTLFNREEGYAFLSEYNGKWIYVREQADTPVLLTEHEKSFKFDGEHFQLFNSYTYSVINARGEFPYNAFNNRNTRAREFISPPKIWIKEENQKEGIIWFAGQHISGRELAKEFTFPGGLPLRSGIGAVEPKSYMPLHQLAFASFIAVLLLMFLHFLFTTNKQERVLLDNYYAIPDSSDKTSFVTNKFHFDKWSSNVQFDIYAEVDNDWFELDATLVNAKTGTEYSLEKGVEYYHGFAEGESWAEGSRREIAYLTQIPAGDYFLQVQGIRNNVSPNKIQGFSLKAVYDVPSQRNFLWSLFFVLLWPVVQYIRAVQIEKKRWYNSPFSPYTYED
jgi:hypothetical protein